ncbi:dihydrofolate reductase [Salana multivorans]
MALSSSGTAEVGMVWAQTPGGVIAADGHLPWDVPEDFQHFRDTVAGRPVVVGRATWESMPKPWRRRRAARSVVVTRDPEWAPEVDDDALRAGSLTEAVSWPQPASPPPRRSGSWAGVRSTRWGSPWRTCSS